MESFKDTINGILGGFAAAATLEPKTDLKDRLLRCQKDICEAHKKLRETIEWQAHYDSKTDENLKRMHETIEWQNWNLLVRAYKSMYEDKE